MCSDKVNSSVFKYIFLRAARLPVIYLIFGVVLVGLSYVDDVFTLVARKEVFDFTDRMGNIFIALAAITFIYNSAALFCKHYENALSAQRTISVLSLASLRKGLRVIFILVIINIVITVLAPTEFYLTLTHGVINTIIIGFIGWILIQLLYMYEAYINQHMVKDAHEDYNRAKALYTKIHILRNIITVLIVIATFGAILMSFSSVRSVGISLLASAGFLTAILGLAAQKTLFSLFSGLQIALSQPIKIGDIVVVNNDLGCIEEITFTYVTLKLSDKRRLMIPINYFIEKPFENWSHEGDSIRSSLFISIDYLMPIESLRAELTAILKNSSYWDGRASKLEVARIAEHSVELRIQISAKGIEELGELQAEVREKLLYFIQEHYPDHFPKVRLHEKDID